MEKDLLTIYVCAPIEAKVHGIIERESVKEPLQTGIKAIDSMVPIAEGSERTYHRRSSDRKNINCDRYNN